MKIHSQLKTLALLCALPLSIFAAQPVLRSFSEVEPAIPASLQAELKRIEDLPDHKVLTEVLPYPIPVAEQYLRDSEDKLKGSHHSLASAQAKYQRSALKYWTIKKELTPCPSGALKQILQIKLAEACDQCHANQQEEQRCVDCIFKNQPILAYNFMMDRYDALASQASILLTRTKNLEKEKSQLQQEKSQSQQREQALQAALNGYQLLEDGLQIEGMPNIPGGVKPKLKRSGSF